MKILEDSLIKFENVNNFGKKRQFVISSVRVYLSLVLLFFFALLIPMVFADVGCCFDSSTGFCNSGTESQSCTGANTQFFATASCAVEDCNLGCCALGTDFPFITARECELRADQKGFDFSWTEEDLESCRLRSLASEEGACILGTYRDKCKITTRDKCTSGDFTPNKNCVDVKIYNQTINTMCYKDSVYFKDSAGNPANISSVCDYKAGTICKSKNANSAYCASLNCAGGKKNGEKWCSFDSQEYNSLADIYTYDMTGAGALANAPVGSRFYSKYCSNGEIYTEPCADYRMESCTMGKCQINKWEDCLAANSVDKETGKVTLDEEACSEDSCYVFAPGDCVRTNNGKEYCGSNRNNYKSDPSGGSDEFTSDMFKELKLDICVPRIPGGQDISGFLSSLTSNSNSNNAKTNNEAQGTCAMNGNFQADVTFFKYHYCVDIIGVTHTGRECADDEWGLQALNSDQMDNLDSETSVWGNAALLDASPDQWTMFFVKGEREGINGNKYCSQGNKLNINEYLLCKSVKGMHIASAFTIGMPWEYVTQEEQIKQIEKACDLMKKIGQCPGIIDKSTIEANPTLMTALGDRCNAISDCDSKSNWVGTNGEGVEITDLTCKQGEDEIACSFDYQCTSWAAPSDGDCSKCGADNIPCSEYKCKAIAKSCEYKEPSGVDRGYCISSNDKSPPTIILKSIEPPSPVEPYTPVEISISTNEASECKFNLNNGGGKYSDMKYSFGDGFGFEHAVKLNLPGQIAGLRGNITEYPLLTSDGKYIMYVRCLDASGNGETMQPYPINFEVMKTPDTKILPPRNFNPLAGSPIKYNTASRYVTFDMLEPAQCKWEFVDTTYENMTHGFNCDTAIGLNPTKNYQCSGILTNITANKTTKYEQQVVCAETLSGEVCKEQTVAVVTVDSEGKKFYIRCKDQPELVNDSVVIKGVTYSRNTMQTSFVYNLRNSDPLVISSISPNSKISVGLKDTLELAAFTNAGANEGRAQCYFKISNKSDFSGASYSLFKITNSTEHRQLINPALIYGFNYVNVKCRDSADNIAYLNSTFNLVLDKSSPKIISLARIGDSLRIKTDENAKCYYSFDNTKRCLFSKDNSTEMQTNEGYVHFAPWQNDKTFYIKCEDDNGNLASACSIAVDTRAYTEY